MRAMRRAADLDGIHRIRPFPATGGGGAASSTPVATKLRGAAVVPCGAIESEREAMREREKEGERRRGRRGGTGLGTRRPDGGDEARRRRRTPAAQIGMLGEEPGERTGAGGWGASGAGEREPGRRDGRAAARADPGVAQIGPGAGRAWVPRTAAAGSGAGATWHLPVGRGRLHNGGWPMEGGQVAGRRWPAPDYEEKVGGGGCGRLGEARG